ncbi:MAG TPA: class I adenylate-forming enzyme family protein [Pseudolabrys sp.]|jgi:acyl-CoA synthetase (AMP-forming)/AMP-acid ligase II
MIASGTQAADSTRLTLDDLFRRAGVRRAEATALSDPSRNLTYAQADRAISAVAARLRALGLATDAVVALQLPNSVESIVALLGILRAGMIAAPLPLLWRQHDMVTALSRAGARAIVTSGAHADIAMQAAAELFPIRAVAGFGPDLPDGVTPLDEVFDTGAKDFFQTSVRRSPAHAAVITFDVTADGIVAVSRNHSELVAGGISIFREAGIAPDQTILSTIPLGSLAGIALTVVPWLLGGGTLALHHGFDPAIFTEQCRAHDVSTVTLPGPALTAIAAAGLLHRAKTILALWRVPEQLAAAAPWQGDAALIDIASFSETDLLAARRGPDGMPAPIPDDAADGLITVGFYRLRQADIDAVVAATDPDAIIAALPDALLGQRLAGSAPNPTDIAVELRERGVHALIAGAFRLRSKAA